MCNAYNHPPGCNCGFGGGNHSNQGRLSSTYQSSTSVDENDAKTFLTACPWCRVSVYYHTNGYGDSVYFDDLGYPWQIHECFSRYWESEKAANSQQISFSDYQTLFYGSFSEADTSQKKRDFFEIDTDQQKRLILMGAVHQIPNIKVWQFFICGVTEEALINQMGISAQQLKEIYGHLYNFETNGIKIFSEEELKQKQRMQNKTQNTLRPKAPSYKPLAASKPKPKLKPKKKFDKKPKRRSK